MVGDATVIVVALVEKSVTGEWAGDILARAPLHAPELVCVETANVLRRLEPARKITTEEAGSAYEDFLQLDLTLYAFEPFDERIWELRHHLTSFDAWYVALAEALDVPLATLDAKLAAATGPECQILTPGGWQVHEPPA
jgi:predicted nucleic acid-binding protein